MPRVTTGSLDGVRSPVAGAVEYTPLLDPPVPLVEGVADVELLDVEELAPVPREGVVLCEEVVVLVRCRAAGARVVTARCSAGGARPPAADSGSEESPMCWLVSCAVAHVIAAVNTRPSNAATSHSAP